MAPSSLDAAGKLAYNTMRYLEHFLRIRQQPDLSSENGQT